MPKEEKFSFKRLFVPLTTKKAIIFIVFIGLIVFFNGLFNNFVLDDTQQIIDNIYVHSLSNFFTFFTGSTFYNGGANLTGVYYKPLLSTFFSVIYTFFGANYFAFHFFQLLLHIASACIVFLILKGFFRKSVAFFLSLIFLIHPVNSESVYYIAATQDTLFFLFGILAFYLLTITKSKKHFLFVILLLFLSILSKETGILFIIIANVYAFVFKRRLFIPLLIGSVILSIGYFLLRMNAIGMLTKAASAPIDRLILSGRLINTPAIFLFYLRQFIFPLNLSSSYQWIYTHVSFSTFIMPFIIDLLFLIAASAIAAIIYKKHPHKQLNVYLFFFFWFLLGLALHLQLYPLDATVADRWFYFPMVGLLGMIGIVLELFQAKFKPKWLPILAMVLIMGLLSIRTFLRSFDWRSEYNLTSHDSNVSSNNYYLENIISIELAKQGKFKEAKIYAEKSISHFPFYTNINTLGAIYSNLGDYQTSKELYFQALKYGDFYLTYENLGGLALVIGNPDENIMLLKNILRKYPNDDKLWLYLAIVDYKQKNVEEAKTAINNAYQLSQNNVNTYYFYKIINNQQIDVKVDTTP